MKKIPISVYSEVFTTIASLLSIFIGWIAEHQISLPSICVSLFFLGVGNAASAIFFKMEVKRDTEAVAEAAANKVVSGYRVEIMGPAKEASRKFIGVLNDAKTIVNTHIVARSDMKQVHDAPIIEPLRRSYREMLARNNVSWTDIIGGPRTNYLRRFNGLTADDINAEFLAYEVAPFPTTNFVIVTYLDNSEEVFWGWELHEKSLHNIVFRSKDRNLIDHYRGIHSALCDSAAEVDVAELLKQAQAATAY